MVAVTWYLSDARAELEIRELVAFWRQRAEECDDYRVGPAIEDCARELLAAFGLED